MTEVRSYFPLVTIVTPVFNAVEYLDETIKTIRKQSYKKIEYIVVDGGSTDGTIDIIKKNKDVISYWISEPDSGMYDALCKGLKKATGDYIGYLNAGDLYFDTTLETVVNILEKNNNVKWITSGRTTCNNQSVITSCDIPFRYKQSLIRKGFYGQFLPFIQQESTFWHRSLLAEVDMEYLSQLKLAGDYFLWFEMAKNNCLHIVETQLGIFKKHPGQLSESIEKYFDEINSFCEKKSYLDRVYAICEAIPWALHPRMRSKLNRDALVYDHDHQEWRLT